MFAQTPKFTYIPGKKKKKERENKREKYTDEGCYDMSLLS
jgi:hypothetical protein